MAASRLETMRASMEYVNGITKENTNSVTTSMGAGTKKKKEVIYIYGSEINIGDRDNQEWCFGWYVLNRDKLEDAPGMVSKSEIPLGLHNLCFYEIGIWGSTIYFLGGYPRKGTKITLGTKSSKTVFAFDASAQTWSTLPPMLEARHYFQVVVTSSKIFVFNRMFSSNGKNLEPWAESYDFKSRRWSYLKKYPSEEIKYMVTQVIYESPDYQSPSKKRPVVLFYVFPSCNICRFDVTAEEWLSPLSNFYPPMCYYPVWSHRVPILDDIVFWHFAGELYGYDLRYENVLPEPSASFFDEGFEYFKETEPGRTFGYPKRTFLVHLAEQGTLLVIWADDYPKRTFYCQKFMVRTGGQEAEDRIILENASNFHLDFKHSMVNDAFTLSIDVDEKEEERTGERNFDVGVAQAMKESIQLDGELQPELSVHDIPINISRNAFPGDRKVLGVSQKQGLQILF